MPADLKTWAVTERTFIQQDITGLKAGAKLLSPSGDNITAKKLAELEQRLEHANKAIAQSSD